MVLGHFVNCFFIKWFFFHRLMVSSTGCFINCLIRRLIFAPISCFINSSFHQLVVSSTSCFINLSLLQLVVLVVFSSTGLLNQLVCFFNWLVSSVVFFQFGVPLSSVFINSSLHQLVISSTHYYVISSTHYYVISSNQYINCN
jgi:hypothetical protein